MKKVIKILAPTLTFIVFAVTINWGYVGLLSKQLIQAATEVASGNGTTSQMLLEELKDFQARDIFNMQVIQKLPFVDLGDGNVEVPIVELPGGGEDYVLPTMEPWGEDDGQTEDEDADYVRLSERNKSHILKRHTFTAMAKQAEHMSDEQLENALTNRSFFNKDWTDEEVVKYSEEAYNILRKQNKTGKQDIEINSEIITVIIKSDGTFDSAYGTYRFTVEDFR